MAKVLVKSSKLRKIKQPKVEYKLPEKKSIPVTQIGGYTILLFGAKKIGKTSLSSHFPRTLFLMFEQGAKALSVYQEYMNSWRKFQAFVKLLKTDERFQTIVIDTADISYDLCMEHVCYDLGIDHPADEGWGKGWRAVSDEYNKQIRLLLNSGKGVIFISHQKEIEIEERSGKKYNKVTNTLSGQARQTLEGLVDVWANYDYEGRRRVLTIMGDDFIDAGHRLNEPPYPKFLYTDGTPIRQISMGKSSRDAYENFISAFNNKLINPEKGGSREKSLIKKKLLKLKKKV